MTDKDKQPVLLDGFEKAFMGVLRRYGQSVAVPLYDYTKCLEILMERDDMEEDEAAEWLEVNTLGGWLGEGTPGMIFRCSLNELVEECDLPRPNLEDEDYGDTHEENVIEITGDYEDVEEHLTDEQKDKLETAISDFALNFMRYIREVEPSLFLRAKQYAADFSGNDMIEFVVDLDDDKKDKK
jgi:hypothetical protein